MEGLLAAKAAARHVRARADDIPEHVLNAARAVRELRTRYDVPPLASQLLRVVRESVTAGDAADRAAGARAVLARGRRGDQTAPCLQGAVSFARSVECACS